jgi:hypothetical protein
MSSELDPQAAGDGSDRRTFIRRMAMTGAFVVPTVATFSMSGLMSSASAAVSNQSGGPSNLL